MQYPGIDIAQIRWVDMGDPAKILIKQNCNTVDQIAPAGHKLFIIMADKFGPCEIRIRRLRTGD